MVQSPITSAQCRAARAMLRWGQDELATKAGVARATIQDFESDKREPHAGTLVLLRQAIEAGGIEFTNGTAPGVKLVRTEAKR
jgi:transcriptional regulator with XRE-family HTH domain